MIIAALMVASWSIGFFLLGRSYYIWSINRKLRKIKISPQETPLSKEEQFASWQGLLFSIIKYIEQQERAFEQMALAFPNTRGLAATLNWLHDYQKAVKAIQLNINEMKVQDDSGSR